MGYFIVLRECPLETRQLLISQQPLGFGTRSIQVSFPCSTKCSKSKKCEVP